jgi:uncharacterized damage-inducible protein DinB
MRSALLYQLSESARHLRIAVAGLSEDQINTPYRPGGWTVRQVVHHLADAQMNWYVRTKLAITEHSPIVKSYDEARWAELQDARTGPLEPSLILLDGISERWVCLYRSLTEEQWKRTIIHPDRGVFTLDTTLPMHVWHCRHHTAHITELRKQMGWNGNGL